MLTRGCDFHPGFQQVAIFDNQTGEMEQRRLRHRDEGEQFYRSLPAGMLVGKVRISPELCIVSLRT